jgi:L-asparaginase
MAISAREMGACGVVRDGAVYFYEESVKRHTVDTEFDVKLLKELPKVSVIYFSVDMDPEILKYAAEHSDGIVIAGAGAGEFSEGFIEVVNDLKIPVVISSRIGDGIIIPDNLLVDGTIAADNLPPQKAAVLLRLALTKTKDAAKIQEMFFEY